MKRVAKSKCGLQIPVGLTMPVRRCRICGKTHYEDDFEIIEIEGTEPEIPGPPEDLFVHWAHKKWEELHRYCGGWNLQRFNEWRDSLGCGTCKVGLLRFLASNPFPHTSTPLKKQNWSFQLHNFVNRELSKPELTFEDARAIYDWPSGSEN